MQRVPAEEVSGEYCMEEAGEKPFENNQNLSFVPTP